MNLFSDGPVRECSTQMRWVGQKEVTVHAHHIMLYNEQHPLPKTSLSSPSPQKKVEIPYLVSQ